MWVVFVCNRVVMNQYVLLLLCNRIYCNKCLKELFNCCELFEYIREVC